MNEPQVDMDVLWDDDAAFERALAEVHAQVLLEHKREGIPLVVSENGKVVWIPPEEIVVPELPPAS